MNITEINTQLVEAITPSLKFMLTQVHKTKDYLDNRLVISGNSKGKSIHLDVLNDNKWIGLFTWIKYYGEVGKYFYYDNKTGYFYCEEKKHKNEKAIIKILKHIPFVHDSGIIEIVGVHKVLENTWIIQLPQGKYLRTSTNISNEMKCILSIIAQFATPNSTFTCEGRYFAN